MVLIYLFENVRHLSNEICQFQCIFFLIILYRYVIQSISSKRPTCIQSQVPKLAFEAVLCKLALTMKAKRPSLETFLEQNSKDVVAELQVLTCPQSLSDLGNKFVFGFIFAKTSSSGCGCISIFNFYLSLAKSLIIIHVVAS